MRGSAFHPEVILSLLPQELIENRMSRWRIEVKSCKTTYGTSVALFQTLITFISTLTENSQIPHVNSSWNWESHPLSFALLVNRPLWINLYGFNAVSPSISSMCPMAFPRKNHRNPCMNFGPEFWFSGRTTKVRTILNHIGRSLLWIVNCKQCRETPGNQSLHSCVPVKKIP